MIAIVFAVLGVLCLIAAGFMVHPAAGLGVTGALLLMVGLLAEFGDET